MSSEKGSDIDRRTAIARSAIQHSFGHPNAPASPPSHHSVPAEKGSCVGLASFLSCRASCSSEISPTHSQPCLYRVPPARFFVSFRCCEASEPLAACVCLLPCIFSPPRHNRLIWRRTGMRYGLSARCTSSIPVWPRRSYVFHPMYLVLTLHPCCCRQRGSLCLVPRQMRPQPQ